MILHRAKHHLKVAIMVPNVDLVVVHKVLVPAICLPLSEWCTGRLSSPCICDAVF